MSSIRALQMKLVDQLFEADPGYVMDFSNNTFSSFCSQELGVDIYDDRFARRGTSKMNRLRTFLEDVDDTQAAAALHALWEYRESLVETSLKAVPKGQQRLSGVIVGLGGKPLSVEEKPTAPATTESGVSDDKLRELRDDFNSLIALEPHARGLAFERFLRELFVAHKMAGQGSINLRGEQIDGSFYLDGQTYLIEAKWQNSKTGAGDLHVFEGKLGQKATWTRGVFISQSGFTDDGLYAFGRGKRLICMDGVDLWDALNGSIPVPEVIRRKAQRASQTGEIFARVRDLG